MSYKIALGFILESLKPFKLHIFAQFIVAIIWAINLNLSPYIMKVMLDRIPHLTPINVVSELSGPVALYIFLSLFYCGVFRFYEFVWLKFNPPLKRHIGDLLMKRMMLHSQALFQNRFAGSLSNKIKDVMSSVPDLVRLIIHHFFAHFTAFIIAIFTVSTINYKFSVLLALWILVFGTAALFFAKRAKVLCDVAAEVRSSVVGNIVDILSNIISVHLFAAHKFESKKLLSSLDKYVEADQRRDWWFLFMFAFQGITFVIYQSIGIFLLISGFKEGHVTAGDFALLLTVNVSILASLWDMSKDIFDFSDLSGNITQGLSIVLSSHEIQDKPDAKPLIVPNGKIVFDNVHFRYKSSDPLFQKKSVVIESGQKVGLVGYSGSGKTTFVNLILRLYDINDGQILIDGQDIRNVTQDSLHAAIGMIPQEPSLFHRSLMDNIRYSLANATDKEVINAAKRAHAHGFISALPAGYESLAGERGVKLSGGQRQRVAIARAILKNAPILILDEATSQLDSITESKIQDSLWKLMQNKTTIVIAHRLSTLLHMDRILVFHKGKIVADGTHKELLVKNALYKTLWGAQVGGFLPDETGI